MKNTSVYVDKMVYSFYLMKVDDYIYILIILTLSI